MSSPLTHGGRGADKAFTLIELLTVIAIIGILAAITFGIVGGVQQRAAVSQARSELATLSQGLESYRKQYGDYPQTGGFSGGLTDTASAATVPGKFFNALLGKLGPKMGAPIAGKQFVDAAKFSLQGTDLPTTGADTADNAFLDPWGNLYVYFYKSSSDPADWKQSSYTLLSAGPDGKLGISVNDAGVLSESSAVDAADNIYANK